MTRQQRPSSIQEVAELLPDGTAEVVVRDGRLLWPDTLAVAPGGFINVTTSRINLGSGLYGLFRFKGAVSTP
ncbi:hypothetical protein [Oryzomonas rubra]|uniref:Uncharacterized protein n=1 Tax=Oryzomonas rubra TaxID=2509454 RepID=A0A5A9XKA8_9BACT|nr:hypothetical protein [Oryzomonas rubra]KAA0893506.1 hypothetical protein ET418_06785 [Oryzomonas rubra]